MTVPNGSVPMIWFLWREFRESLRPSRGFLFLRKIYLNYTCAEVSVLYDVYDVYGVYVYVLYVVLVLVYNMIS